MAVSASNPLQPHESGPILGAVLLPLFAWVNHFHLDWLIEVLVTSLASMLKDSMMLCELTGNQ